MYENFFMTPALQHGELNGTTPMLSHGNPGAPISCQGCLIPIMDSIYLSVADFTTWHVPCLRCSDCSTGLDSEKSCFIKMGKYLCRKCYQRRFRPSAQTPAVCARCNSAILAKEMVMHAKDFVYHVNCFTCCHCSKLLTTGDHYGMKDSLIFCRQHFEMLSPSLMSQPPLLPPPDFLPPPPGSHQGYPPSSCSPFPPMPYPQGMAPQNNEPYSLGGYNMPPQESMVMQQLSTPPKAQKGRPRKKKTHPHDDPFHSLYGNDQNQNHPPSVHDALGMYMSGGTTAEQQNRAKRVRTSFKNHQLRVLKQYFQLNHNPDAKELKQLSQKTGLSKRVLQVWFQNARAKYRRLMMKNQANGGSGKCMEDELSEDGTIKECESGDELDDDKLNPNSPSAESISDFGDMMSPELSDSTSPIGADFKDESQDSQPASLASNPSAIKTEVIGF